MDRHKFRAVWHDYNEGIYFVTICAHQKQDIFGKIVGTRFIASELGEITEKHINNIPSHYDNVEIWNHVVMPNHVHMIIAVGSQLTPSEKNETFVKNFGCLKPPRHDNVVEDFHHNSRLATIIGTFKAGVTRRCGRDESCPYKIWQSRYHEHIIRNQRAFENIMNYIDNNVLNWHNDCFNPVGTRFIASAENNASENDVRINYKNYVTEQDK